MSYQNLLIISLFQFLVKSPNTTPKPPVEKPKTTTNTNNTKPTETKPAEEKPAKR